MEEGAENHGARKPPHGAGAGGGGDDNGGNGGALTGLAAVQGVFHFLPAPADVLRAATACRRWRELACADSVWRAKFEREGLVEKARVFEVALPAVEGGEGGGGNSSSAAAASERDGLAGVGLAFYAQVFALEVRGYYAGCASGPAERFPLSICICLTTARARCCRPLCQGYKMRDEGINGGRCIVNPDHDGGIHTAISLWCRDPAAAKARYGPIASWDTSAVTNMRMLFHDKRHFNEDISHWNVSNVVSMRSTFHGASSFDGDLSCWDVGQVREMDGTFFNATSFDRQLGGAWATSTAHKYRMFYNSPGTIAGKTKDAYGTIE